MDNKPKKPNRPLSISIFPPKSGPVEIQHEFLPLDQDNIELSIANKFINALSSKVGKEYRGIKNTDEPGDVEFTDENGERILLQIGEAVDLIRVKDRAVREGYGLNLWKEHPDLVDDYKGVQIAFIDTGEVRDIPHPNSKEGKSVLIELHDKMKACISHIKNLPINEPSESKGIQLDLKLCNGKCNLLIRLRRYKELSDARNLKWIWVGPRIVRPNDNLSNLIAVIEKKIRHYGSINSAFWLLIYSIDTFFSSNDLFEINKILRNKSIPFDVIYLFYPIANLSGGTIQEIYPNIIPAIDQKNTELSGHGAIVRAGDFFPKWDDCRFVDVEIS